MKNYVQVEKLDFIGLLRGCEMKKYGVIARRGAAPTWQSPMAAHRSKLSNVQHLTGKTYAFYHLVFTEDPGDCHTSVRTGSQ